MQPYWKLIQLICIWKCQKRFFSWWGWDFVPRATKNFKSGIAIQFQSTNTKGTEANCLCTCSCIACIKAKCFDIFLRACNNTQGYQELVILLFYHMQLLVYACWLDAHALQSFSRYLFLNKPVKLALVFYN